MVRTSLDVKKLQSVQEEALRDTNRDAKQKAGATAAIPEPTPKEKKKFDEKNAVRRKAHLRLHRDVIAALHEYAEEEKLTYTEVYRQVVTAGMRQLGIKQKPKAAEEESN